MSSGRWDRKEARTTIPGDPSIALDGIILERRRSPKRASLSPLYHSEASACAFARTASFCHRPFKIPFTGDALELEAVAPLGSLTVLSSKTLKPEHQHLVALALSHLDFPSGLGKKPSVGIEIDEPGPVNGAVRFEELKAWVPRGCQASLANVTKELQSLFALAHVVGR